MINYETEDEQRKELDSIVSKRTNNTDFTEACRPLIKYLAENHHPHIKVIVHSTGAEMLEGVKTTGEIIDYLRD
jgi:hypothetical protein